MSPTPRGRTPKRLMVTLRLSRNALTPFLHEDDDADDSVIDSKTPSRTRDAGDKSSDSNNATPTATDTAEMSSISVSKGDGRKKRGGAAMSGRKRAPPMIDPNGPMKERGRPGPKKKPRLPDGTIDRSHDGAVAPTKSAATAAVHKLGPKANTGAINAGLRALDRSGKPCRKWERKGLSIKSFTGTAWGMSTWKAPLRDNGFSGDVKSDSTGSSDLKPNESSVLASERSQSHADGDTIMTNGIDTAMAASSPAPIAA